MSTKHFECIERRTPCQHIRHYPRATAASEEDTLSLIVKQYKPRTPPKHGDVTFLAAPALSCAKELYEPLWDSIYECMQSSDSAANIRSIWCVDFSNQGASGVLNGDKLGDEPSIFDHARDLLLLVNEFREEMPAPIFGFGHSMGGTVMLNLSLLHPRLLSGLVLVEPAVLPDAKGLTYSAVYPLTFRRDTWPSREAAVEAHKKSPFYRNWDARVLDRFRQYGFRDLPTALHPGAPPRPGDKVTLVSTKHQDVLSYARSAFPSDQQADIESFSRSFAEDPEFKWTGEPGVPFYRPENILTFGRLPSIRPPCFFVYGEKSHWQRQNGPGGRRLKREITGGGPGGGGGVQHGQVAEAVVDNGSHYVPMELPDRLGREIAQWLAGRCEDWRVSRAKIAEARDKIPQDRRGTVSPHWLFWAEKYYKGKDLPEYIKPKVDSKL